MSAYNAMLCHSKGGTENEKKEFLEALNTLEENTSLI